jgi:hypothetical protein
MWLTISQSTRCLLLLFACGLRLSVTASFKQQVMIDVGTNGIKTQAGCLISVETPTLTLIFLDCFTNILMAINLHAYPFFQFNITPRKEMNDQTYNIGPSIPSDAPGGKRMKRDVVLYVDAELVEKTRKLRFNLSKTFENHLEQLLTLFSALDSTENGL